MQMQHDNVQVSRLLLRRVERCVAYKGRTNRSSVCLAVGYNNTNEDLDGWMTDDGNECARVQTRECFCVWSTSIKAMCRVP